MVSWLYAPSHEYDVGALAAVESFQDGGPLLLAFEA